MVVLVTGANGQLGQSLQFIAKNYSDSSHFGEQEQQIDFVFCDSSTLDITNFNNVTQVFQQFKPNYCINAAAYTAVDKAESEPEKAHLINAVGAKNIADVCKKTNCILLHISTDFVFDGTKKTPYTEEDQPNPTGVYGQTKLDGEKAIQNTLDNYFIIRTSWVYSQFGANFMKTMLRLASERDSISVVNDQIGTPTHALDLAECLLKIIQTNNRQPTTDNFGIYHFSNEGQCSWYDFAKKIFEINNINLNLQAIPTTSYPTPAQRPCYSVLDKSKIKRVFGIEIKNWEESLK
ncbi:dTDP-4-dehydrorhamnose reductase [Flavobacterium sp.]|uniref:dTDP-4-dehydrorhamnose reductase n=1 Tax=Flavobacterium sp. TaxID=239 RepID=UPI002B4B5885|nr:dTDP-4-dehydrorhamnose reductase [Flavobacterium sp.]HLP63321.1 dTDP-4-dehydrorhamnose reductase [Flavobacterium sp.]